MLICLYPVRSHKKKKMFMFNTFKQVEAWCHVCSLLVNDQWHHKFNNKMAATKYIVFSNDSCNHFLVITLRAEATFLRYELACKKVASADNHSIFYRACAKFVTRFASNWFVKSAWVLWESNLRKLLVNNSPPVFLFLFFCFAPSGFKYFSQKISMDCLFGVIGKYFYTINCSKYYLLCIEHI